MENMNRITNARNRADKYVKEGKAVVMGDEIVVRFERGSKRASAARAAEYASRIYAKRRDKRHEAGDMKHGDN